MPVISSFFGISIRINFKESEHNPPHFHAQYGDKEGIFDIRSGKQIEGNFKGNALRLVNEWYELNKVGLMQIWETQEFMKLPPLD